MSATTSPFLIDTELLLHPITADQPSGQDLRYAGAYDRIREMRREEGNLPQGVWTSEVKRADWAQVSQLCTESLTAQSKDLQLAAWLLEAWLHLYGFAGVAAGFELLSGLLHRYWDTLYPRAENDDLEYRAAPFNWINEKLNPELKLIPFVYPDDPDSEHLSWADWELACFNAGAVNRKDKSGHSLTQDDFQRALHLTPFNVLQHQLSAVGAALSACSETQELLNQKFGREGPSLRSVLSVLGKIQTFLAAFTHQNAAPALLAMAEAVTEEPAPLTPQAAPATAVPHPEVGPISSRAEAYHWLAAASEYLARTEPHSPTPYLVRRAIRWGSMSLEQLLPELVRNPGELTEISKLLHITSE